MLVIATLVHCSIMLLFGNCIIVCHMFLELYSLYCNDLYCPLLNLNAPQRLVWASFDFKNIINIHDLYPTLTSLIRTLFFVPSVSVLERFDRATKHFQTNVITLGWTACIARLDSNFVHSIIRKLSFWIFF